VECATYFTDERVMNIKATQEGLVFCCRFFCGTCRRHSCVRSFIRYDDNHKDATIVYRCNGLFQFREATARKNRVALR
jgi:hypothetical protein